MYKNKPGNDYFEAAKDYRAGATLKELAKKYGITRIGIYKALKKHGITEFRNDRRKISDALAVDLRKKGLKLREIAKKYNCTPSAVWMFLKKYGYEDLKLGFEEKDEIALSDTFVIEKPPKEEAKRGFAAFQEDFIAEIMGEEEGGGECDVFADLDIIEKTFSMLENDLSTEFVGLHEIFARDKQGFA